VRFLLGIADLARWPFERLAWLFERRLLWPLRERIAGWGPSGRAAGAGALAVVAIGALLVGVLSVSGNNRGDEQIATPTRVAIATSTREPQAEEPKGPVLQGTPPTFRVGDGVGVAKPASGEAAAAGGPVSSDGEASGNEPSSPESTNAATTSSTTPVPAGPEAMKVARRFSEAFVFYEIGERPARAKTVFGETATPQLATALSERPPRLPQSTKVPKARVVNLVAGPRSGKAYTVSVSLLRVGLTSELRLEMKKSDGTWQVTDVRG
jgi:hypothetical protein